MIREVIGTEGGYVDDPEDSGGETRWGITEAVARQWGYDGHLSEFPETVAHEIYERGYWHPVCGDTLLQLSESVIKELFDTAVNCGVKRASQFLQTSLNAFNRRGKDYADVTTDGKIGPATRKALRSYLSRREDAVLVKALNCLQGAHYLSISQARPKDERFVYGWFKNRITAV